MPYWLQQAIQAIRGWLATKPFSQGDNPDQPLNRTLQPAVPSTTATPPPPALYPALDVEQLKVRLKNAINNPHPWPRGYQAIDDNPATPEDERRTFCNKFVMDVSAWFSYKGFLQLKEGQARASDIVRHMATHPEEWERVTYPEAQQYACMGRLVIAGIISKKEQAGPNTWKASGHVCVVAPEPEMMYSGKWKINVPMAANVGTKNFYSGPKGGLNYAFGDEQPRLYVLRRIDA